MKIRSIEVYIINKNNLVARRNKTEGKMTLTVDAAGAAFNSSTTTVSVKRLAAVLTPVL